jgi:hypothetical protein
MINHMIAYFGVRMVLGMHKYVAGLTIHAYYGLECSYAVLRVQDEDSAIGHVQVQLK